jgi:hypothetical protein
MKANAWAAAALFIGFLLTWAGISISARMGNIPGIAGSMTFDADPETRIYIGDKLIGTGKVTVSWEELLGNERQDPLAIELPGLVNTVNAEWISGPGARILDSKNLSRGYSPSEREPEDSYLLRRADGSLDHVMAYLLEFRSSDKPRSYLILVRPRKGAAGSTISFERWGGHTSSSADPGIVKLFGRSPMQIEESWH